MAAQKSKASELASAEATARYASRYSNLSVEDLHTELENVTGKGEFKGTYKILMIYFLLIHLRSLFPFVQW